MREVQERNSSSNEVFEAADEVEFAVSFEASMFEVVADKGDCLKRGSLAAAPKSDVCLLHCSTHTDRVHGE